MQQLDVPPCAGLCDQGESDVDLALRDFRRNVDSSFGAERDIAARVVEFHKRKYAILEVCDRGDTAERDRRHAVDYGHLEAVDLGMQVSGVRV